MAGYFCKNAIQPTNSYMTGTAEKAVADKRWADQSGTSCRMDSLALPLQENGDLIPVMTAGKHHNPAG